MNLNENDRKLLAFCSDNPKSIRTIAERLKIAPKNVSVRLTKLKEMNLIEIKSFGKGKKTIIKTKKGNKHKKAMIKFYEEKLKEWS